MNIVLSGPFGMGSLSDELVLAGILKPLRAAKHNVTVLTANKSATEKMHGVTAVHLASASSLLSTPLAWKALNDAHLFVLCGAGVISGTGKPSARAWLAQLEHVKQLKLPTAVVGVGAVPIDDKLEQVRVQRLLHHFADGITVRDADSKSALIAIGLNANRVSITADPTLALFLPLPSGGAAVPRLPSGGEGRGEGERARIAFHFSDGVPLRHSFSPEPTRAPAALSSSLNALLKSLLEKQFDAVLFHDSTQQNEMLARAIAAGADPKRVDLLSATATFAELSAAMKSCSAAITDTLHGLLFAAAHRVPVVYLCDSSAPKSPHHLITSSSLASAAGQFDAQQAEELLSTIMAMTPESRQSWLAQQIAPLARKEAQNVRMLERLVPKRLRYPKRPDDAPRHKKSKQEARPRKSPVWNRV